jgi:predicted aspartyl protease
MARRRVKQMVLVKARVRLLGTKATYSANTVLADSGARMSLVDRLLAERVGVQYTGREINFVSVSGHAVKASEAIVSELEVEGEVLRYEAVAVAEMPNVVKETLKKNGLDENIIVGVLTLERANMVPDTTTGKLEKVESFIF